MKSISAIRSKFNRLNLKASHTKLIENTSEYERTYILENTKLDIGEVIIIVYLPNVPYWWILTNTRLIIKNAVEVQYISLAEIEKVEVIDIFDNITKKQDCTKIDVIGSNFTSNIIVEKNTWHGVYSILKFASD